MVDFGWFVPRKRELPPAVGPGQAAGVGDGGVLVALGDQAVIGRAGEEQLVGVGGAAGGPVRAVVDLIVVAGFWTVRACAAAVAGVTCIGGAPLADAAAQFGLITICGATDRGLLTSAA